MDPETLIVPALLAAAAAWAWLSITAHRADVGRALVELCRRAVELRAEQESLAAAGRPAPFLERARLAEAEFRALLRRRGF